MQDSSTTTERSLQKWPLLQPLRHRNYLLLWLGSVVSYIGANLTFIAFPWLVLKISGDPIAIGSVLALAGIPRAAFMLFGGAVTDRYSPKTVMLVSTASRLLLMLVMATMVWFETITMWQIFVLAFLFGTLDAFFWPASSAIVPRLLDKELLPAANALLQGCGQASLMLGPLLAGLIISFAGEDHALKGIAIVFYLDVVGFAFSLVTLYLIRQPDIGQVSERFSVATMMHSLTEGLTAMWRDTPVRLMAIVIAVFTLFFRGPHLVGIPVLADARFEEGALAFGMIMSSFGVGALLGIIAAGSMPPPRDDWLGKLLLADLLILGATFIVYAVAPNVELAMAASVLGGLIDGYVVVIIISWLQKRIHESMIGRVMSVIMFANNGLAPVSAAGAGWLITFSLEWTFLSTGFIMIGLCLLGLLVPMIRQLGLTPDRNE
ncbi:MAG: MFS transporter [Gammaproteobacteria bacterium]|jgi:MFS family permease|nr:MFS transporter [Gammaproteobacteria bacterium]MBT4493306.1 MFS transporter [Gammaproteobacteria bacterium]MBT7369944.1 MFS transporter [Gammaproteobacteria bacterium]